jgi:hypothetical protein
MLVYLMRMGRTRFYKIGITKDIQKRMMGSQVNCPLKLKLISSFEGGKYAPLIELKLQKKYKLFLYQGEWFKFNWFVLRYILREFKKYNDRIKSNEEIKIVDSYELGEIETYDNLYDVNTLSKLLPFSTAKIRVLYRKGILPMKKINNKFLISKEDLEKWIDNVKEPFIIYRNSRKSTKERLINWKESKINAK